MKDIVKKIWKVLGSVRLTTVVLLLLVVDLAGGYLGLKGHENLFKPLNDLGLIEWIKTYGITYASHTAWFFGLLILLFLLAVNTFVCTTNRVFSLAKFHSRFTSRLRFILKFSAHIMHYALIVILIGYLVSYLYARTYPDMIIVQGQSVRIPHSEIQVQLGSLDVQYYQGSRLKFLNNRAINVQAALRLTAGQKEVWKAIGINAPFRFKGLSFHLKDFAPQYKSGMKRRLYINLIIKDDPGMMFCFTGTVLFIVGLCMYLYQWFLLQAKEGKCHG